MPTYDYRCKDCGHEFEIQQSFSDDALTECPRCAGDLRKVFSAVGISFKGSGFYKTDSRSSSGTSGSAAGSSESGAATKDGGSGSKDSGSSDSGSKDSGASTSSSPSKPDTASGSSTSAA